MNDAGPLDTGDAAVLRVAGQQRVDQRPRPVADGGMDDETGGLVDDEHVVVLVDDGKRDRLGLEVERLGIGNFEIQNPAGDDRVVGLDRRTRRGHVTLGDELLDVAARES